MTFFKVLPFNPFYNKPLEVHRLERIIKEHYRKVQLH